MRVALGQIRPVLGDVAANVKLHVNEVQRARTLGAHVVVFPELGLTGYILRDLTLEVSRRMTDPEIQTLLAESVDIDIVFSFVEESPDHKFYVASVYAHRGQALHVHRKVYLPTYGLFEEGRHLAHGDVIDAFALPDHRAGMMICEDAWHPSVPYLLSVAGSDVLYVPAAGPGRALSGDPHSGSQQFWERVLRTYAQLYTCYIVFVNRVGFEDGVFFFGHSFVVGPGGDVLGTIDTHETDLMVVDLDLAALRRERYRSPFLRDEDPHLTARSLARLLGGR